MKTLIDAIFSNIRSGSTLFAHACCLSVLIHRVNKVFINYPFDGHGLFTVYRRYVALSVQKCVSGDLFVLAT